MADPDLARDERAASAVVGKVLAAGIAVLYISVMTTLLFGGVVPDYRTASGAELGDRVLATAAGEIERNVPAVDGAVELRAEHSLPETIRDEEYELVLSGETLELDHPDPGIGGKTQVPLPPNVAVENATWTSSETFVVVTDGPTDDRTVTITEGR